MDRNRTLFLKTKSSLVIRLSGTESTSSLNSLSTLTIRPFPKDNAFNLSTTGDKSLRSDLPLVAVFLLTNPAERFLQYMLIS